MIHIPLVDLRPSSAALQTELLSDISSLFESAAFINGSHVATFEDAFARYCGALECVGVASGLDALRLALIGCGIESGDDVIIPAQTFVATVEAVMQSAGRPVLVDVSEADYGIDPEAVAAAIGPRTRFLLPVHLFGQLADMARLTRIANEHDLVVVEDACQAHGAERVGHRAGRDGTAGCFSFYPTKNLGAMGDAGAVTTPDANLAQRLRALREHGQTARYIHTYGG